jgi:hypothetical protein
MTDIWRLGQAHTVANLENTAWAENAVCKDRCQTICFLSIKPNMSISTVHTIKQHPGYFKMGSQCVPCLLVSTYKENRTNHWNICSSIILRVMCFCGRLWWAIRPCVTVLFSHENQQACKGDTSIHPNQTNSSNKHLSEKRCWMRSSASRDACYWTSM